MHQKIRKIHTRSIDQVDTLIITKDDRAINLMINPIDLIIKFVRIDQPKSILLTDNIDGSDTNLIFDDYVDNRGSGATRRLQSFDFSFFVKSGSCHFWSILGNSELLKENTSVEILGSGEDDSKPVTFSIKIVGQAKILMNYFYGVSELHHIGFTEVQSKTIVTL